MSPPVCNATNPEFRWLGLCDYRETWKTLIRKSNLVSSGRHKEYVYACEHLPVYTVGKREVCIDLELPAPLIHTDRGGEVTFHGPGQLMFYPIIRLRQRRLSVRQYVYLLEQSCIDLLEEFSVPGERKQGKPGVWVGDRKLASIGLRVAKGTAYHGMALNVANELHWFSYINPCGTGLPVTSLREYGCLHIPPMDELALRWRAHFLARLQDQGDLQRRGQALSFATSNQTGKPMDHDGRSFGGMHGAEQKATGEI